MSFGGPAYWSGCNVSFTLCLFQPSITSGVPIPDKLHLSPANILGRESSVSFSSGQFLITLQLRTLEYGEAQPFVCENS